MDPKEYQIACRFTAGPSSINTDNGSVPGVTVAEVGPARGHFCFLDRDGKVLGAGGADEAPANAAKRIPLAMDEASLRSIVAAVPSNKKVKTREDHSDAISARAGYAQAFRIEGTKCICDLQVYDAYQHRALFLETAMKSPEQIGLSGDFKFTVEVKDNVALMRVTKVDAVDIVDQGALTHAGLFSAGGVDMNKGEILTIMAKAPPAPPDLKAFKAMCDEIAEYRAAHADNTAAIDECMTALLPPAKAGNASPVVAPQSAMTAAEKTDLKTELTAELSAVFATKLTEATTAITNAAKAETLEFRKQMSALGIKAGAGAQPTPEEIAAAKALADAEIAAKAAANGTKDASAKFFELKASIAKERKVTPAAATNLIIAEQPQVWDAYQIQLGVRKAGKAA